MDPREQILRQIEEAATNIKNISDFRPDTGIILGSGLGEAVKAIQTEVSIPYNQITHFPISTVSGHPGNLVFGKLEEQNLAVLQGRFHFYEGYTMWGITFPVRVLAKLGIKTLIVTGACGGLRDDLKSGGLVALKDHLNLMPANPLIGPHVSEMGPRFVDMSDPYDLELLRQAEEAAKASGIDLKTGVYAAVAGPNYETGAETAMLKKLGADVVGMSIVPEVIVAKQMGLKVLGITVVSNEHEQQKVVSHEKVLENVGKARASFVKLLQSILNTA